MQGANSLGHNERLTERIGALLEQITNERPLLDWLALVIDEEALPSALALFETPDALLAFTKKAGLYSAIPLSAYLNHPSLSNYVTHLTEIWRDLKDIDIFAVFSPYLHTKLNPSFVFQEDFESLLYSHGLLVFAVLFSVSILTVLLVNQELNQNSLEIFELRTDDEEGETLQDTFRGVAKIYEELERAAQPVQAPSSESKRRISTLSDLQILKKIEDQQSHIDSLEAENRILRDQKIQLVERLQEADKLVEEQRKKSQQLAFSRDDLLDKIRKNQFALSHEELEQRESEIKTLRDRLRQREACFGKSIRELEEDKETLHKKVHQLENYVSEFQNAVGTAQRGPEEPAAPCEDHASVREEAERWRAKCLRLEEHCILDKERCIKLEMEMINLHKEIEELRIERRELEFKTRDMPSFSQINNISELSDEATFAEIVEDLSADKLFHKLSKKLSKIKSDDKDTRRKPAAAANDNLLSTKENAFNGNSRTIAISLDFAAGDEGLQREIRQCFANYQQKCMNKIKAVYRLLEDSKETQKELSKDREQLRSQLDEALEKTVELENGFTAQLIASNVSLKDLFDAFGEDNKARSAVAQDLLQMSIKKEAEISRLKLGKKRLYDEALRVEGKCVEQTALIYSLVRAYVHN